MAMAAPASKKRPASAAASAAKPAPSSHGFVIPVGWIFAALIASVLFAYLPTLRAAFIWNDSEYVTAPAMRSLAGLWRIWFDVGSTEQYYPLLHSAFWVEHKLWGDAPVGYHLANILWHALSAGLFGLVLRRLQVPGAWLAAFIFALHPVCVESVAWISEQKNTLSLVFYLAAALAYLRFDETRRASAYALATGLFVCALLSKTTTATLPPALLVIFWWRRGKLSWRTDVLPLLPWFALGAAMGLFTAWVERTYVGAEGSDFALNYLQRALLAGRIIWFYLAKLVWPADLIFIYPRWTVDTGVWWHWLFPVGVLALVGALWVLRARSRAPLAALLLFAGSLFPVLGFFNVFGFTYSFVADHWQYLPSLALIALAAAGLTHLLGRSPALARGAACGALVALLTVLTWKQSRMYNDIETFYRTTIAQNPDCWMAYNNLGRQLAGSKARVTEAISLFEKSLAINPNNAQALSNLGLALAQTGRPKEAVPLLEKSIGLLPRIYQAHNNYGIALAGAGRWEDAVAAFKQAAKLNPYLPEIHDNWARVAQALGHEKEAGEHFAEAARLRAVLDALR
jgi:tetratricopeptide (TPR) repeat protein